MPPSTPAKRITFTGSSVAFTDAASPAAADDKFEVAGLVNPTIASPVTARVSIQFVNADGTSAHGLVVGAGASSAWMPMMTSPSAFTAAGVWFLGDCTSAGAHTATVTFTTDTAGNYHYLCPVPGHAQKGMAGPRRVRLNENQRAGGVKWSTSMPVVYWAA